MASPFRSVVSPDAEDMGAVFEAVAGLRSQARAEGMFSATAGDALDKAVFSLIGGTTSPFTTDAALPNQERTGSRLDRASQQLLEAQEAVLVVLRNAGRYPTSER